MVGNNRPVEVVKVLGSLHDFLDDLCKFGIFILGLVTRYPLTVWPWRFVLAPVEGTFPVQHFVQYDREAVNIPFLCALWGSRGVAEYFRSCPQPF